MSEDVGLIKMKKRDLGVIVNDALVGIVTFAGTIASTSFMYEKMHELGPTVQEYTGLIGRVFAQYTTPGLVMVGGLTLTGLAVKATDYYLTHEKGKGIF